MFRRILQLFKKNIQHFKTGNFFLFLHLRKFLPSSIRIRIPIPPPDPLAQLNTNSEDWFPEWLCLMTGCAGCLSLSELARTRRGGARGPRYVWRVWVVQTWSSLSRWLQAQNRISQAWVQQEKRISCQIPVQRSGSGSISFWASGIVSQRYGTRFFHHQTK
jgi:hypothetical protein